MHRRRAVPLFGGTGNHLLSVDYFAAEAKEYLASAAELGEEMEHNAYASQQTGGALGNSAAQAQADRRIEELKGELLTLAAQCRDLCGTYVQEKRDGYIQVGFSSPATGKMAMVSLFMALLFTAALAGSILLKRERRAKAGIAKKTQEVTL